MKDFWTVIVLTGILLLIAFIIVLIYNAVLGGHPTADGYFIETMIVYFLLLLLGKV